MKAFNNKNLCLILKEEEDEYLEELFLYIYDYSLSVSKSFINVDIVSFLNNEREDLKASYKELESLGLYKKWWLYHLFILKKEAKDNELKYLLNAINKVIYNINDIEVALLAGYINAFNESMFDVSGDIISTRPKEYYRTIENKECEDDLSCQLFLNLQEISDTIKTYTKDGNIKENIFDILENNKFKNFINKYELMAEFFVSIVLASLDTMSTLDDIDDIPEVIREDIREEHELLLNNLISQFVYQSFDIEETLSNKLIEELKSLALIK